MEESRQNTTGMLKNEYAKQVGIPCSTLRNYMNKLFLIELSKLSYTPRQKYLTPLQVNFLNSVLVITQEP